MEDRITQVISEFPEGLEFYITQEESVIECLYYLLGTQVTPFVTENHFSSDKKKDKVFFYTPQIVTTSFKNETIWIKTFYENHWNLILGAKFRQTTMAFLESFKGKQVTLGYTYYPNSSLRGYEYNKGELITTGLKFTDLIGLDEAQNAIIKDIDTYFTNIDKFRSLGTNRGLNYIIYGPPGTGKTSFSKALAYHYNANFFIPGNGGYSSDVTPSLNPATKGKNIVLMDDFNPGHNMTEYIHAIFDNACENTIRIFVTNTFGNVNHTPFVSRCRRIFEFKAPTAGTITLLISRALDVTEQDAKPLAQFIEQKEAERLQIYNERLEQANKQMATLPEDKRKDIQIKPFEPLGYRDINFFLSDFIGVENPIQEATMKIESWFDERGGYIGNSNSSDRDVTGCGVM